MLSKLILDYIIDSTRIPLHAPRIFIDYRLFPSSKCYGVPALRLVHVEMIENLIAVKSCVLLPHMKILVSNLQGKLKKKVIIRSGFIL